MDGQLDIERDLCANCFRPIHQPKTGRRRRTCSDRCRQSLSRKLRRRDLVEGFRDNGRVRRRPSSSVTKVEWRERLEVEVVEEGRRWVEWGGGVGMFLTDGLVPPGCIAGGWSGPDRSGFAYERGTGVGGNRVGQPMNARSGEVFLSWAQIRRRLLDEAAGSPSDLALETGALSRVQEGDVEQVVSRDGVVWDRDRGGVYP